MTSRFLDNSDVKIRHNNRSAILSYPYSIRNEIQTNPALRALAQAKVDEKKQGWFSPVCFTSTGRENAITKAKTKAIAESLAELGRSTIEKQFSVVNVGSYNLPYQTFPPQSPTTITKITNILEAVSQNHERETWFKSLRNDVYIALDATETRRPISIPGPLTSINSPHIFSKNNTLFHNRERLSPFMPIEYDLSSDSERGTPRTSPENSWRSS